MKRSSESLRGSWTPPKFALGDILSARIPRWGAHITFWDWVIRTLYALGTLTVAWWAMLRAIADGTIESYGTLGYIAVIGAVVAIACLLAVGGMAVTWSVDRIRTDRVSSQIRSGSSVQIEATASGRPIGARPQSLDRIHHKNEKIALSSLVTSELSVIENRIFENCDILGPACLIFKVSRLEGSKFRGALDIEVVLLEIPQDRRQVSGVIEMRNCEFIDCVFVNVGVIGNRSALDLLRKAYAKPKPKRR
jgi:hypothetical protein